LSKQYEGESKNQRLIFSHGRKRAKKIQSGKVNIEEADLFDVFRCSTTIHGKYYKDTHQILGRTYGVCVLQDFEAITPNLLARTIETVEGGGLIILLLKTISSLKQLYTLNMDIHKRYRTESHQDVKCRFNERLILSLADCDRCLLVNDSLTVLPLSQKTANVDTIDVSGILKSPNDEELEELKESLRDTPPAGPLINLCKTLDQAKAVAQFIDQLAEKQLKPPTSLTAARGRGKSAAMGLAVAGAVSFGYSQIYVTSPTPENLITFFEFVLKGFDALAYQEHLDYTIIRSTNPDFNKAIVRVNLTRNNRQTIQFIAPGDSHLLNAADLLVVDEAAAIPLPLVKKMLGPYLVFMASTINGYEGTGRSLSLKLLTQIQKENNAPPPIKLDESIRYNPGDSVEKWLTSLLCLDVQAIPHLSSGCPTPDNCELYYIDRDALFSFHRAAEGFLQRLVSIFVSSHYKNTPNDLQMLSDAPAHHLFCLLGPITKKDQLPEILVVIQVCLEGKIQSRNSDSRAAGDLIPWNVSEQFNDREFTKLSGARIVRIATHPNYQRMGYGKRAMQLLKSYYEGKFTSLAEVEEEAAFEEITEEDADLLTEVVKPRKTIPTLLKRLNERKPEVLDYIGTSYGLTQELLKFWKSHKFIPVYLSQKENDLTGEHSCIMIASLSGDRVATKDWLQAYFTDFRRRVLKLLPKSFTKYTTALALSVLDNRNVEIAGKESTQDEINARFIPHDVQRLESYVRNQIEYRLILDLTTDLAAMYFEMKLPNAPLDALQKAILLGIGGMNKNVDQLAAEFNMPSSQVLAKFYDTMKKLTKNILGIMQREIEETLPKEAELNRGKEFKPLQQTMDEELDEEAKKLEKKQRKELTKLKKDALSQYAIKGTDEDWKKALTTSGKSVISVKSGEKRGLDSLEVEAEDKPGWNKNKKKKFQPEDNRSGHNKKGRKDKFFK
jgi:N-acetyltransferase 10